MSHRHLASGTRHALIHATPLLIVLMVLVLVALGALAVSLGAVAVPLPTVWGVIARRLAGGEGIAAAGLENIVWHIRVPRVLLAALVGAALALVGAALQAVTRNPLADPHLLGISSGASLGAITVLLHTGLFLGLATLPIFAFLGALLATAVVVGVARAARATDASRLVLVGVAIGFILTSAGSFGIFLGDPRAAHTVIFWMMGGLGLAHWTQLPYLVLALFTGGGFLFAVAGNLNAMTLGDETATTLGTPARRLRLEVFVACALLTGAAVAFAGVISFVGLMTPHAVRLLVGGDYRRVLPLSALAGAIFLVGADIVARTIVAPQDIPVGIVTGLAGGVFFVLLLRRARPQ